jgi:putative SOS response-associated peptidase YedK
MCGRMTLTQPSLARVAEQLGASVRAADATLYRPRYNIAPTDLHWVVRLSTEGRELIPARWGMLRAGKPMVNARSESLEAALARPSGLTKSPLHRALAERRCAVPADGFFEWTTSGSGARRPLWFHRPDGGLLFLAALYEEGPDGRPLFTVLTTDANGLVSRVHDRMPALLAPDAVAEWLARPATELLQPAPDALLMAQPVSPRVNSVRNDDPSCLDAPPDEPEPSEPQLKLL